MDYARNLLQQGGFAAEFLKFPDSGSIVNRAYLLGTQYKNFRERLEKIFTEQENILPEFPIVFGMIKREIFPQSSLKEYHKFTDQKIIDEFQRQKVGDPRNGLSQGYIIVGTMEKMLQNETLNYLEATVSEFYRNEFCKREGIGKEYDPRQNLWNTIEIATRLKPAVFGSVNESLTNRLREI